MHKGSMQTQATQDKKYVNNITRLNEGTPRHNSPKMSYRLDKSKNIMSPTLIMQQQKEKSTSVRSQTIKTTQPLVDTNNTNINNPTEEAQDENKNNTKLRTIFRGGIIGIMGGKPRKRKIKDKRRNKNDDPDNNEENNLRSLFFALEQLSRVERLKKAMRHFRDSLSLKPVRHDIELNEGWFIPMIYFWQTSPFWQNFLFIVGLLYPLASFVEPPNQHVGDYTDNSILLVYEMTLLSFVWIDIGFEYFHRYFDKDKSLKEHYLINHKLSTRTIIGLFLFIDLLIFHLSFPNLTYRFSRYLRPFLVFYYSHELRRTLISILKSMKQITQLVIFISALTFFIAVIGWRFIGNLDDPNKYDQYSSNFSNLGSASSILYSLISFDSYPECIIPSYKESPFFSLYFVIYCVLLILILIPIPVSVVYDSFRTHRSRLVLIDRIKQREALLSCFISLDFNNQKSIDYKVFHDFMACIYLQRKRYIKRIKSLYQCIDQNESMSVSMNEFFDIIDVMDRNPQFQIPKLRDYKYWDNFRSYLNKKFNLKSKVKSCFFEFTMVAVLIANCAILFIGMSATDDSVISWTDQADDYFFYVYILEFILKIIGIGIEKYFEDSWNTFDFSLVFMSFLSLILSTTLTFLKNAKSAKATKLLRLTKINRVFRIFKALRSIKFLSFLFAGVEVFYQVKLLIQKIIMCLPIVMRLVPIILMLFYIYTYIALENFNTNTFEYKLNSPYDSGYLQFNSFHEGLLIYFQVMLEAGWSSYIYDLSYKFDQPYLANAIFISFDFIIQFILLSLIKGIVWEVFTVVNEEIKYQEQLAQQRLESTKNMELKDQNNIIFLRQAKEEDEVGSIIQKNTIKEQQNVGKSIFQTNQQIKLSCNTNDHLPNEIIKEGEESHQTHLNLTSEFKGIMLYEKILRNLTNVSHNNSIICNEGKIPYSPKLNERQYTWNKVTTEESGNEKEIVSEHKQLLSNNIINETKQIKTSPQKRNINNNHHMNKIQEYNTIPNNNHNYQYHNDDKQYFCHSSNNENNLQNNPLENEEQQQNSQQSAIGITYNNVQDKKKIYIESETDIQNKISPLFPSEIISKSRVTKSKSWQHQYSQCKSIQNGIGAIMKSNLKNFDTHLTNSYELTNSKELAQKKDGITDVSPSHHAAMKNLQEKNDENKEQENNLSHINQQNEDQTNKNINQTNKTFLNDHSFMYNQDSSISELPLKSDLNMKSYLEGPFIMSEAPQQILAKRSYTNTKSNTPNDITLENPCDDTLDMNRITNEQIFWLKKRIKTLSQLKKIQQKQKRQKGAEVDFSEQYIFSDDEDAIDQYTKQIHDYIYEDEIDFQRASNKEQNQDVDEMGTLNFQYMMKRALLKESNMEIVKKLEIDYFQQSYGSFFNAFHEVNISPILRYESFLIYNLQRILRVKTIDNSLFFQILISIENNLSNVILRKGSLVKFAFQDSYGNWICLKEINKNVYPCLLGNGPWSFYDKIFKEEGEIYVCRDFLMMNKSKVMQNLVYDFYQQLKTCARCLDHDHQFLSINPDYSIFDFFTIFGQNKVEDQIISLTSKTIKKQYPNKKPQVQIYCKKVMVFFLSYIGESEQEKQEVITDTQGRSGGNGGGILKDMFKNKDNDAPNRKKTKQNIRKLDMEEVNKKQAKDKDKINEQSTLPMAYIIEMIKSIQDLLDLYSTNFYIKISELINQKLMSKSYFEEIMEENKQKEKEKLIKEEKEKKEKVKLKKQKTLFQQNKKL